MKMRIGYSISVAVVGLLANVSAVQACAQWSAAGVYRVRQSNGFTVSLTVFQEGQALSGRASYPGDSGLIEGTVDGPQLNFVIYWNDGARGDYDALIDQGGMIVGGTTYDLNDRSSNATWNSAKRMRCAN